MLKHCASNTDGVDFNDSVSVDDNTQQFLRSPLIVTLLLLLVLRLAML